MKLESLNIQNFRACKDVLLYFDSYTCLVGPNGAGKSTVLTALNILFRNTAGVPTNTLDLTEEDFYNRDTSKPIQITATFKELPKEAEGDLKAYVRQGKLVFSAKALWDGESKSAAVKQYGARMVMKDFAPYFQSSGSSAKATELKEIYNNLRIKYPDLPKVTTKGDMEAALRDYEEKHPDLCTLMDSEDQFYGFTHGTGLLSKYIQWVYIPAVKDASTEQDEAKNTALGSLLQRTIRSKVNFEEHLAELRVEAKSKYLDILKEQQHILDDVSSSLESKLQEWAHPGASVKLKWNDDPAKSVVVNSPFARVELGENDFIGEIARLGHGMQRAFITTILHELATASKQEGVPTLLLGFEEPELYQHPPQARHLAKILEKLAKENAQVIVTTHSPYFISGRGFENVRMVRRRFNGSIECMITHVTHEKLSESLAAALGTLPQHPSSLMATVEQILQPSLNELFFCGLPVLVEGIEDVAYLSTYLELSEQLSDFRRIGGHFIVCEGKNKMSRPLAIARLLSIPVFVIFDSDNDQKSTNEIEKNRCDNSCILKLCSISDFDPLASETLSFDNAVMCSPNIGSMVQDEIGRDRWNIIEEKVRSHYNYRENVRRKNTLLIAATLEQLWHEGEKAATLMKICEKILTYGSTVK